LGLETAQRTTISPGGPVVVGLDGGYVRSRHQQEERHFEVIAGKVIDADGIQHRFAFARNGQADVPQDFACSHDSWCLHMKSSFLPSRACHVGIVTAMAIDYGVGAVAGGDTSCCACSSAG
jgi:hypothetical protein